MTPQEFFKKDLFAENAGVVLLEVREGYSKAKLEIKPEHLNAGARTQGGAIFTLADLALAAAAVLGALAEVTGLNGLNVLHSCTLRTLQNLS